MGPPAARWVREMGNGRVVDPAEELELAIALAVRAHHGQRYPSPEREPYILLLFV